MADQWIGGEWKSPKALAIVAAAGRLEDVPVLAKQFDDACRPCPAKALIDRLTALGMTMAPNRPQAEASMWLHETARLVGDIPEDILLPSIDELQKRLKFLPTVAEIRQVADPVLEKRHKQRSRLDAMRRYLESGQPIPALPAPRQQIERTSEPITAQEAEKLNAYLSSAGASTRFRDDGSTVQVDQPREQPQFAGPRREPSRADYLALGVDPSVLDGIEAEKRAGA